MLSNPGSIRVEWIVSLELDSEQRASIEEESEKDANLKQALHQDVSPHSSIDDHCVAALRVTTLHNARIGRLCGKGESSECVHDEVDPEHLYGSQRSVVEDQRAREDNEEGNDVDRHLELKELADVVEGRSAILHSTQDAAEVIVEKLDIGRLFGNISAGNAHGKADVTTVQGRSVICTIAGNSNSSANLNKSVNKHEFVIWLGSCQDLELALNLFELAKIANRAINSNLVVLAVLFTLDAAINLATELLPSHADVVLFVVVKISVREYACFASDSLSSFKIITGNHTHVDTGLVAGTNSLSDTGSERVLKRHDTNHGETDLSGLLVINGSEIVVGRLKVLPAGLVVVSVCEKESAVALLGELLHNVLVDDAVTLVGSHGHLLAALSDVLGALLDDDLGGALDEDTHHAGLERMLDHRGRSLATGVERQLEDNLILCALLDHRLHIDFALSEVLDESNFSDVSARLLHCAILSALDERSRVVDDALFDELEGRAVLEVRVAAANDDLVFQVGLDDLHLVQSERASFVSADLIGVAHGFAALHAAHQVVLLLHLADREGQADGYGKGQAFRDGDNHNRDAKDESVKHISDVLVVSQAALLLPKDVEHSAHANDDEDENGDCESALANLVGNRVKLVLKRGLLLFDVH